MRLGILWLVSVAAMYLKAEEPIPNSYLVVFRSTTSEDSIATHQKYVLQHTTISRQFSIGNFRGYAATFNREIATILEQRPEVAWVEEDGLVWANQFASSEACKNQTGAPWGIVRTSERQLNLQAPYEYPETADGSGVTVYVFDTGIYLENQEFEGRAVWGTNTVDSTTTDGNGHGTHCAGVVGGKTFGMAKQAKLVAVKVLSDSGAGSISGIIQGIDWAVNQKIQPSVGSMSVGGSRSTALNSAVTAAAKAGLLMAVPAGNSNADACNFSPGSTPEAITVATSDQQDQRVTGSNWGPCVSLYAPGVLIPSAWIGKPDATATLSGGSTAAPHVAGEAAKYLQTNKGATAAETKAWILKNAQKNVVKNGEQGGTPNLLLFADCSSF